MSTLPSEFKRKVADLYLEKKTKLEELDTDTMESFASELLTMIQEEKDSIPAKHDLEVLESSMKILKNQAMKLKWFEPETDAYDFTLNDCKNLVESTKRWLKLEGLL
ncbi:MAG: hypothetical protein JSW14_05900 [Candidatus Bathyarchaeum sp.]|nr:MAG: hypothetical protein JSW14_05900 [Candidatus Bathyarchaeum sp.]